MTESEINLPEKFDDTVLNKCKEICLQAADSYQTGLKVRTAFKNAFIVISKFKQHLQGDSSLIDLQLAKETYKECKAIYVEHSAIVGYESRVYKDYIRYQITIA